MVKKNKSKKKKTKKDENKEEEFDLSKAIDYVKKIKISTIALVFILIFGFYLRNYHVDYPVIGYHNWKETHYLTEARNFAEEGFFKYGFFVPYHDIPSINDDPSGVHPDTFPIISIILGLFFKIFGISLTVARMVGIFFSLGTVLFTYLLVKRLFKREDLALTAAMVGAINPLLVFFSHNTQLVNPGVFFMVVSGYFFAVFLDTYKSKDLIFTAVFAALAALAKYPFLLIGIPMFLTLLYRVVKSPKKIIEKLKKIAPAFIISILILSTVYMWIWYAGVIRVKYIGVGSESEAPLISNIKLETLTDATFWQIIIAYSRDNFTIEGIYIAALGLILLLLFFNKSEGNKFFIFYFIGSIAWFIIMSFKLSGHNYHMFPIAPLFFLLTAYFFLVLGNNLESLISKNMKGSNSIFILFGICIAFIIGYYIPIINLLYLPVRFIFVRIATIFSIPVFFIVSSFALLIVITTALQKYFEKRGFIRWVIIIFFILYLYAPSKDSWSRMYDTQFIGLDMAGDYIRQNSIASEKVYHSSHQSYGVLWHADRKGYKPSSDLNVFQKGEDLGVNWYFVYQWQIPKLINDHKEIWKYMQTNYSLKQVGYTLNDNQPQLLYMLFKRGGSFNATDIGLALQEFADGKQPVIKDYEYTAGKRQLYVINE